MSQISTAATGKRVAASMMSDAELDAYVEAWLPDDFDYRVATKYEEDEWFALAIDFDVTGKGVSRMSALREMKELLAAYLAAYMVDGQSFKQAVRPVPARLRLRIQVESATGRLLGKLHRRRSLSREDNYILPASEVAVHARC